MANTQQESGKTDNQQQGQTRNLQSNEQSSRERNLTRREQSYPSRFGNSPFSFMRRFSEEMDGLFEDFGFGSRGLTPSFSEDVAAF